MKKLGILLLMATAATALTVGCGDDSSTGSTTTTSSSSSGSGSGSSSSSSSSGGDDLGTMPTYGAQVDRMGRPAINTALNSPFEADATKQGMAKDAWNASADETKWGTTFATEVGKNLAILDGLDGMCGNQAAADPSKMDPSRYATLAGVLSDDRLWLKTDATTCTTYLAVEANATGLIPNMDCGGRALNYDVIDASYTALSVGLKSATMVTDGIDVPSHATGKTFPYLAAPK